MQHLGWILANLLIVAPALIATWLQAGAPNLYYRVIQEDHWMEWSTVWAFLLAMLAATIGARRQWRERKRLPWFLAGLALFSFLIAMEEISWGQRLFSFTPPEYFLTENFQQELNIHNIVASDLRQFGFLVVVIGYGVLLPLSTLLQPVDQFYKRIGVVAPPAALVPAFAFTAVFYNTYAIEFTGEWAELMLGLGMCIAVAWHVRRSTRLAVRKPAQLSLCLTAAAMVLGFMSMLGTNLLSAHSETSLRAAEIEVQALKADFQHERVKTRCGAHKRIYTFRAEYGQSYLNEGTFAGLQDGGLDDKRARFFLDPWNMPYWIRHRCVDGRDIVFVYSYGPNRRRDSTEWEISEDDIGAYIGTTPE